jgi:hypothetical protein
MGKYDRVWREGRQLDKMTLAHLQRAEKRSGVKVHLIQGSYNSSVGASAGTHDGGGAYDVWPWSGSRSDAAKFVHAARVEGGATWDRTGRGDWQPHIHGIVIGNDRASYGAKNQVAEYRNGYDGLAGSGRDYHWRPSPIKPFRYRSANPVKKVWDYGVIKKQFDAKRKEPKNAVRRLQIELHKAGYHPGPADGIAGPQTQKAFRNYRGKRGPYRAMHKLFKPFQLRRKN